MISGPRLVGPHKLAVKQGSDAWLAARREHVTASMIPTLLEINPWRCEQDLADEILTGEGQTSTLKMRVGNALEDLILGAYSAQTGRKCRRVRGLWESAVVPWAAASPDATAAGPGAPLVEAKWSGSRSRFADGLPEDVEAQCQWQAFVAEVREVDVAALTVGDDEVRVWTVHANAEIQSHLVAIAADFRRRLAAGGPFAQSADSLKRKYPADDGSEIAADAEIADAVRALVALRDRRKAIKEDEGHLETAIKTRMATATRLVGDGWNVSWKRTKDRTETDWKAVAADLLAPMPEPDRAAVVGSHGIVREGFRPFRVTWGKGDSE